MYMKLLICRGENVQSPNKKYYSFVQSINFKQDKNYKYRSKEKKRNKRKSLIT